MNDLEAVAMADYLPLPSGRTQYARAFIEARGAIVLRRTPRELLVGIASDAADRLVEELSVFHRGQNLRFGRVDRAELTAYLGAAPAEAPRGSPDEAGAPGAAAGGEAEGTARAAGGRVPLDKLASDAPIVNLVNSICIDGIRSGASDIHIEALEGSMRVRYRIDGSLRTARKLDKGRFEAVSSRIKVMADLNIMERRLPQDGRISVDIGGDSVDLRVSVVPVAGGESIVLRLFSRSSAPLGLDQLGFEPGQLELIGELLKTSSGLVLVTGPTGSGKTTTLNAMLRAVSSDSLKVVTIEDPVECLLDGVSQIQTNERIGLGFDAILRRVLRQDPNVVMVGEIRDGTTAELAVRAAMTGHLVLSSLHTNDSASVALRLRDMGVEPYMVAAVLRGAMAQRLVRRLCPACAREREATGAELELLEKYGYGPRKLLFGPGCGDCGGSGFRGRIALSEGYAVDRELEELILNGERTAVISDHLMAGGMKSLARDGMDKAVRGLTAVSELEREVRL
jgi:type II secretory ATPase GspE/PulE/Tfp pilus assembly ATPase PilB-like protein